MKQTVRIRCPLDLLEWQFPTWIGSKKTPASLVWPLRNIDFVAIGIGLAGAFFQGPIPVEIWYLGS